MAIRTHYILVLLLIWILTTAGAYYIGTLNPDPQLVKNIKDQTELKIQKDYSQHKLFEPEFAYNDNESFMLAVNKCIDFVNLTTPPSNTSLAARQTISCPAQCIWTCTSTKAHRLLRSLRIR